MNSISILLLSNSAVPSSGCLPVGENVDLLSHSVPEDCRRVDSHTDAAAVGQMCRDPKAEGKGQCGNCRAWQGQKAVEPGIQIELDLKIRLIREAEGDRQRGTAPVNASSHHRFVGVSPPPKE